jgi:putative ATP-dependent endonuclease of the OLD family
LGARRSISFSDADFFEMSVSKPLKISVTLGELDDSLKTLESYGLFVRGFSAKLQEIEDEPDHDLEAVLTIELSVTSSLEPEWLLVSERAKAQDMTRDLSWADRVRLAPTRIADDARQCVLLTQFHGRAGQNAVLHDAPYKPAEKEQQQ